MQTTALTCFGVQRTADDGDHGPGITGTHSKCGFRQTMAAVDSRRSLDPASDGRDPVLSTLSNGLWGSHRRVPPTSQQTGSHESFYTTL